jgi:hypothetical protein
MKRVLSVGLLVGLMAASIFVSQASAEELLYQVCQNDPQAVACQENKSPQDPGNNTIYGSHGVITKAAQILTIVIGVAAVIAIIIGGLQYITATGDPSRINEAKNTILYALVGIVVAIIAQSIIVFVIRRL